MGPISELLIDEGSKLSDISFTLRRFFTVMAPRNIPDAISFPIKKSDLLTPKLSALKPNFSSENTSPLT